MQFIDVKKIKIASSEEDISKTIEELLELNKLIPKRTNKEITVVTEKQFDSPEGNKNRWQKDCVTENQFGNRDKKDEDATLETRITKTPSKKNGPNKSTWEDKEVDGLKHVAPIWHQIKKQENKRKKQ